MQAEQPMTYYINEEMLGSSATVADANEMVSLLRQAGIDAEYGYGWNRHPIPDDVWMECLERVAQWPREEAANK